MNASFADSIDRAQRSIDVARALFRGGLIPECHSHMIGALNEAIDGWASLDAGAEPQKAEPTAEPATTRELGLAALSRADYGRIDGLRKALADAPLEAKDIPKSIGNLDAVWTEIEWLVRFSVRRAITPQVRKVRRRRRAVGVGLLLAIGLAFGWRTWVRPRVHASAVYSAEFPAANAIDGVQATEWLLPDNAPGWIDVIFAFKRTVNRVRLINAHNRFHLDRAAQAVRVTAFTEFEKQVSVEGGFTGIVDGRSVLDLPLHATGVTRLRVEVLTFFSAGGGLAEIKVD